MFVYAIECICMHADMHMHAYTCMYACMPIVKYVFYIVIGMWIK